MKIYSTKQNKNLSSIFLFIILFSAFSCRNEQATDQTTNNESKPLFPYNKWVITDTVLTNGPHGNFDEIAVKDPTIVFYNGKYHLFYTSKATYPTAAKSDYIDHMGSGFGYVSAETIEGLNKAERYFMSEITESIVVAPQIFYFEPHKLWYLVAQTVVKGETPNLKPIYLTNPDIEDVNGWSDIHIIETSKSDNSFWIDFWVICDDEKAHLFYTDHKGSMFRFECPIEEFPDGFAGQREETVLTQRGETEKGRWRLHEASHIYYVKEADEYLAILEAVYPHPTRRNYWESRNRFMFAMVADKLEGPWERVEPDLNEFAGDPENLYNLDGTQSVFRTISHPELIRSGYDQKLEIDNYDLQLVFQAFDADTIGSDYDYNYLPYDLYLMRN